MPERPAEKSQLAIDAMAKLAQMRAKEAVPLLSSIAQMQLPDGVSKLIEYDERNTAPETRSDFRQKALRLLQYNAANALGIIGDKRGLDAVRAAFASENSAGARIQHAMSMACLGDSSGVDYLVQIIAQGTRRDSAAAAKVFAFITGKDFNYTENTPVRARPSRAKMYRDWWRANRGKLELDRAEIMERRLKPDTPDAFEPRSTRDLLKISSYYFDFNNKLRTVEARQRLAQAGKSLNADFQKIASDPMEELNIRLEAINWYYEANRANALALLKRLRRDENPEIADKANSLIELIETDSSAPVTFMQQ